jgi:phage shock protein PspC (stress-responsive transcriptional regulator)
MTNGTASTLDSKLFRSERYRTIGGVCAGVAIARGYSITLTRLIALFLLSTGFGLLLYFVLWLVLPRASSAGIDEPLSLPHDRLQRNASNRMLAGVCSGLAEFFKLDVSIVRIVYLIAVLCAGVGILPYLYAWFAVPQRPSTL